MAEIDNTTESLVSVIRSLKYSDLSEWAGVATLDRASKYLKKVDNLSLFGRTGLAAWVTGRQTSDAGYASML